MKRARLKPSFGASKIYPTHLFVEGIKTFIDCYFKGAATLTFEDHDYEMGKTAIRSFDMDSLAEMIVNFLMLFNRRRVTNIKVLKDRTHISVTSDRIPNKTEHWDKLIAAAEKCGFKVFVEDERVVMKTEIIDYYHFVIRSIPKNANLFYITLVTEYFKITDGKEISYLGSPIN